MRLLAAKAPEAEGLPARLERVRRALEEERRRFYTPEEMDPYRFGTLIRNRLVARGLVIDRYQTLSAGKETLLEFSVQGDARALVSFFREVSQADPLVGPLRHAERERGEGFGAIGVPHPVRAQR